MCVCDVMCALPHWEEAKWRVQHNAVQWLAPPEHERGSFMDDITHTSEVGMRMSGEPSTAWLPSVGKLHAPALEVESRRGHHACPGGTSRHPRGMVLILGRDTWHSWGFPSCVFGGGCDGTPMVPGAVCSPFPPFLHQWLPLMLRRSQALNCITLSLLNTEGARPPASKY